MEESNFQVLTKISTSGHFFNWLNMCQIDQRMNEIRMNFSLQTCT